MSFLERLGGFRSSLSVLCDGRWDEIGLLLLVGGALDLLEERSEDAAALGRLWLLFSWLGDGLIGLALFNGSRGDNCRSCLTLQLLSGLGNVGSDDRSGGGSWSMLERYRREERGLHLLSATGATTGASSLISG